MITSVKLALCRHHPAHWYLVKGTTSALILIALFAPEGFRTHAAIAANMLWIWIDP